MKDDVRKFVKIGGIALAAYALCAFIQSQMEIPFVGAYLPKKS